MSTRSRLLYALVVPNAPWWNVGVVTQKALSHYGVDVELRSFPGEEFQMDMVARGEADLGVNQQRTVGWAYRGVGYYAEQQHSNLRAVAAVAAPNWLAFAVRRETGITAIEQIPERRLPLRLYTYRGTLAGSIVYLVEQVLAAYGFSFEDIESWGGRILTSADGDNIQRDGLCDAMLCQAYPAFGPAGRRWVEATVLHDMRFLPIREDVRDKLAASLDLAKGSIPATLFRGIDEEVPTFEFRYRVVYTHDALPEETAYLVARALDEHSDYFLTRYITFAYNPFKAYTNVSIPLHPGAERYYREKGYLK